MDARASGCGFGLTVDILRYRSERRAPLRHGPDTWPAHAGVMAEPKERPLSLSGKLRACVTDALARCLSLRVRRNTPSTPADAQTLSPILRRGDVLLTDGITLL